MEEVARHYGVEPGRSGFMRCPFHRGDHTASLKIYPGAGGWHCFGCQKGGSVIDFVMELYDIDFRQACIRLNSDFGLGLAGQRPDPAARSAVLEKRRQERAEREKLEGQHAELAKEHCYWNQVRVHFSPNDRVSGYIHPLYAEAVNKLPRLEWELEKLEQKLGR